MKKYALIFIVVFVALIVTSLVEYDATYIVNGVQYSIYD